MSAESRCDDILADLLRPGLRLVICGTAASTRSASIGAYYAGPGNKFWRTLHAVGLTPTLFAPIDWPKLGTLDIGLTDLAKRHSGMDRDLPAGSFDVRRVQAAIAVHEPAILAFNGKAAGGVFLRRAISAYGPQPETVGATAIWVLPSTSGAASGAWSIAPWQALADVLADLPTRS